MSGKREDLTGRRIGKWVVLGPSEHDKACYKYGTMWLCRCDCGVEKAVWHYTLTRDQSKSCGCGKKKYRGLASKHALYVQYRIGARRRGLDFQLTEEEFERITQGNCVYCGMSPQTEYKPSRLSNGAYIYNGIDRVDNDLGYTVGNSAACCNRCNIAKHAVSEAEFLEMVRKIYEYRIKKA